MSNGAFPISMRDIKFVLYEQLGIERLCEFDKFKDFSRETFDMVLEEGAKLAAEIIAPLNSIADKEGCVYEKGKVKVPEAFHKAFKKYCEGGWIAASVDAEAGGQGLPNSVALATAEMFVGACCSFTTYPGLTRGCANLIESFGTPEQKQMYLEKMYNGQWTGTMCLTEPQAGSAVGDVKSMAKKEGDHYLIQGTKIFITAGDHDLAENIIHAVLARTENAPPGVKGLSLFIVPKVRINPDGSVGEPNDVNCGGIEHKMGLKGSSTCTLNFGDDGKCHGYILGQEGQGIQLMFQMMNEARLGVGLQGFSLGNLAYLFALKYARERIQGVEVTKMKDPNAPRVPIIKHPDVRRMLMTMKAYAEGLRALIYRSAYYADLAEVATDPQEKEYCGNMIDLLIPIVKAYSTDIAFRLTEWAIQVHGGYGYCGEYPVEQICRDVKITSIYEGTNGIQAMDLVGRKLSLKKGALFMGWMKEVNEFIEKHKTHPVFGTAVGQLEQAKNTMVNVSMHFAKVAAGGDPLYPMLNAYPYLELFGEVELAYLLIDQAIIAQNKLRAIFQNAGATTDEAKAKVIDDQADAAFYSGKVYTADFFASNILPKVQATAMTILGGNRSALNIPDAAF
ncbi:MAG: acyl-CoA dehydrogenase [Deltaproteobacteria bacterium RBG_19FT_COMBO_52_11]|nr:MAG: acyl-CoA dehydrogenase [Deltaproteobacteria bacterium RBG_19FT_COMBO_52_11]